MYQKIYSTEKFKKGDTVWFCTIELQPSGKIKTNARPCSTIIEAVYSDYIKIDTTNITSSWYKFPTEYYIDSDSRTRNVVFGDDRYNILIGPHISFTKDEAIDKYNELLKEAIENRYQCFKKSEYTLKSLIL